jgi:hypothetical protein
MIASLFVLSCGVAAAAASTRFRRQEVVQTVGGALILTSFVLFGLGVASFA